MAKRRRKILLALIVPLMVLVSGLIWIVTGTSPTPRGPRGYVRYERPQRLRTVLDDLQQRGILKNAVAMQVYSVLTRHSQSVPIGTYSVGPGMRASTILSALSHPIRQFIRVPETNWANQTANYLAIYGVLNADEYMQLVRDPRQFQSSVDFPLNGASLEGYLYPDTYDLPPLIGAREVILRQLKNFDRKVWKNVQPKDLQRTLIIASMVQMESGRSHDSAMIAGVIENRLKKKMPLQIDSTLLYGIQKWRRLSFADYRKIDSPYNTYTHTGLPPGPICSPTLESIEAALNPAQHDYLYYVALPDGETIFSKDYKEHLKKIKQRKAALAKLRKR